MGGTYEETPLLWLYCLLLYEKREIILSGPDLMRLALFKKKKIVSEQKIGGLYLAGLKESKQPFC